MKIIINDLNLVLERDYVEKSILSSDFSKDLELIIDNGIYHSYRFKTPHYIKNKLFLFTLYFKRGLLKSIHLFPYIMKKQTWNNITKKELNDIKKSNDLWLVEQIGVLPDKNYSWGCVLSSYDEKSWTAEIIFSF